MNACRCSSVLGPMGETLRFTKRDQDIMIHTVVEPMASEGLRTICVAYRDFATGKSFCRIITDMSVRLSVRLSHAGILSKQLYISSSFFHLRVAPPVQIFCTEDSRFKARFRRRPPNTCVECMGYEKNYDFRPISRFISDMMQDRAIVTMEGEQEPHQAFEWYQFE